MNCVIAGLHEGKSEERGARSEERGAKSGERGEGGGDRLALGGGVDLVCAA